VEDVKPTSTPTDMFREFGKDIKKSAFKPGRLEDNLTPLDVKNKVYSKVYFDLPSRKNFSMRCAVSLS